MMVITLVFQVNAKVMYDFTPQDDEELEMKKGEIVHVMEMSDPNWWVGELTRGSQTFKGCFPRSYVQKVTR